jgi:electron-transferring-flavoprotein dehydrogenase
MPRNYVDGGMIVGDSGSFLDSQRLKGIHMAIKSGMLAAETIYDALRTGDTSARALSAFAQRVDRSYIKQELRAVRNFHQSFQYGLYGGLFHTALQFVTGGRGLIDPMRVEAGHKHYHKIKGRAAPERFKGDGKLTFDRLTDVYHSGTRHEEDQPCHLMVRDLEVCATKCTVEYGNPCQYFCPAAVYEPANENGEFKLKISAANCVHCKTCDIADPYQIIDWVVPEGGGGPNYEGM